MNKALAEIIAGMIPHKMTRNRYRGILRYGLGRAAKLRKLIKADRTEPTNYLSVCAIAKNEGPYFKEWLDWHIGQGVEKFYVYDNESTDNTKEVLKPYIEEGFVDYKYWPGSRQQLSAYDDCFENHRFETRWLAVIDLDEFIVPLKDKSLPEFLKRFEDFSVVEVNWLIYGSGGQKTKTEGTMMERFRFHSLLDNHLNRHVKSIVDPRRVYTMIGSHEAARISGFAADSHGKPLRKNFRDREPQHDIIRINHYAVRSFEEFAKKQERGSVRGRHQRYFDDYFSQYDLNDVEENSLVAVTPAPIST